MLTIVQCPQGGEPICLSQEENPALSSVATIKHLEDDLEKAICMAFCGIGDGYLLHAIAEYGVEQPVSFRHCIHICEPHAEVLYAALQIHDYTGPDGPIEQKRFEWFVGLDWQKQLTLALRTQPMLPYPVQLFSLGIMRESMVKSVDKLADEFLAWEKRLQAGVTEFYRQKPSQELIDLLGSDPPRKPRAALLTSMHTSVLQYSIADIATGLEQEGWETSIIIESVPHHCYSIRATLLRLREFQPDVMIQIDHLRREYDDVYPPELPFVCWIQDDLPNLTNESAGANLHHRDFTLTCAQSSYTKTYGYPERQCIYVNKLSQPRAVATGRASTGPPDLAFVSNASQIPSELVPEIASCASDSPETAGVIEASCREMISVYERGGSIDSLSQIRNIIDTVTDRIGGQWQDIEVRDNIAIRLSGHLNNALYRQQALDWIIEVAERLGLSLELYGQGWENNPKYAQFAKGYIQYGQPLEELTRRAKINFQIVPYSCLHQRLLDGLTAGGFFLIREHPFDVHSSNLAKFMAEHITPDMGCVADAEQRLSPSVWNEFVRINQRNCDLTEHAGEDLVRAWQRYVREDLSFIIEGLPQRDAVSFSNVETLEERIRYYLESESRQTEVQTVQRQFVEEHLTYRGGFHRIMRKIGHLIATEVEDGLKDEDLRLPTPESEDNCGSPS